MIDFGDYDRELASEFAVRLYMACRGVDNRVEVEVCLADVNLLHGCAISVGFS